MILYHGSNVLVEKVDLQKCRPYKDFGRGFYCTEIKEQAELMAKRVAYIYGGSPCVSIWEMNNEVLVSSDLNIKTFTESSAEWAMFVLNNRNGILLSLTALNATTTINTILSPGQLPMMI